jgi:indolepyruvate ferredoxin oxidoreductase
LQEASLLKAIELNGVAVEANKQAFDWGRRAAVDLAQVERIALPAKPVVVQMPQNLQSLVRRRAGFLAAYQDAAYARRYEALIERVRDAEAKVSAADAFATAVARGLHKLMAYKDEYEVARLYTNGDFERRLQESFEGKFRVKYNLAPPLLAPHDAQGRPMKREYGSWMLGAFKLLAKLKFLRGSVLDPFGRTEERRLERQLIVDYERSITAAAANLTADNLARAVELASLPDQIRGFGHVKAASVEKVRKRWRELDELFGAGIVASAKVA